MNNIVLKFMVEEEVLLKDFLIFKGLSRKTLTRVKFDEDGFIKVDGIERSVRYALSKGQCVEVTLPSEEFSSNVRFIEGRLDILYEDEYLMILNKPPYLPTIPARDKSEDSLLEYLNYYFRDKLYSGIPHIVTRLDKNTSGLVLVAKHRCIHASLDKLEIDKYYLALAQGQTPASCFIEKSIALSDTSIIERVVSDDGDYAKTYLERISYNLKDNFSYIRLKLYTGRTHQIRVHCKYIGHTLLGDSIYGGDISLIPRQALHCSNLKFKHPISGEQLDVVSPLFEDMSKLL